MAFAVLLAYALFLQGLLTGVMGAAHAAQAVSGLDFHHVICTEHGVASLPSDAGSDRPHAPDASCCVLGCVNACAGLISLALIASILIFPRDGLLAPHGPPPSDQHLPSLRPPLPLGPRAPPLAG